MIHDFPLIDKPPMHIIQAAYRELYAINAIDKQGDKLVLTTLGNLIVNTNLNPQSAKALYHSSSLFGCSLEMLQIISVLEGSSFLFQQNPGISVAVDSSNPKILEFFKMNYLIYPDLVSMGDIMHALFIFRQFLLVKCLNCLLSDSNSPDSTLIWKPSECSECTQFRKKWAFHHYLDSRSLFRSYQYYSNLHSTLTILSSFSLSLKSSFLFEHREAEQKLAKLAQTLPLLFTEEDPLESMMKVLDGYFKIRSNIAGSLFAGFFMNLCYSRGARRFEHGHIHIASKEVLIPHPSSKYAKSQNLVPPEFLIYYSVVVSTGRFMKFMMPIDPYELKSISQTLFEMIDFESVKREYTIIRLPAFGHEVSRKILCWNRDGYYELENEIAKTGAVSTHVYIDSASKEVVSIVAADDEPVVRSILIAHIEKCKEEAIGSHSFQYTYSLGTVLVVGVGATLYSIQETKDSLAYQVTKLAKKESLQESVQDFKNLFKFQGLSIKEFEETLTVTVYFTDLNQAEAAAQALKDQPMHGINGPVSILKPVQDSKLRVALNYSLTVPSSIQPNKLRNLFQEFKGIQQLDIITTHSLREVTLKFDTMVESKRFLDEYPVWALAKFGEGWNNKLKIGRQKLYLANPLKKLSLVQLCEYLDQEIQPSGTVLSFSNIQDGYITILKTTNEGMAVLASVLDPEVIPLSFLAFKLLKTYKFIDGNNWNNWQRSMCVSCWYNRQTNTLEIYGHPRDKSDAREILHSVVSGLEQSLRTEVIRTENLTEYFGFIRQIKEFREITYLLNRRDNSITITGQDRYVNSLLKKLRANLFIEKNQCNICYKPYEAQNELTLGLCGHSVHTPCLRLQVLSQLDSKPFPELPLACLECTFPLVYKDWIRVLTPSEQEKLYNASVMHYLSTTNDRKYALCEGADCGVIYNKQLLSGASIRTCTSCGRTFCVKCKREVFNDTHGSICEMERIQEEHKEDAEWISKNTQQCPTCHFPIQKKSGCNHITCPRCRTHYCFICSVILDPKSPTAHFLERDSTCYAKLFDA